MTFIAQCRRIVKLTAHEPENFSLGELCSAPNVLNFFHFLEERDWHVLPIQLHLRFNGPNGDLICRNNLITQFICVMKSCNRQMRRLSCFWGYATVNALHANRGGDSPFLAICLPTRLVIRAYFQLRRLAKRVRPPWSP